MSVETTTTSEVTVPVKLVAREVLRAIENDYSVLEVTVMTQRNGKSSLYMGGSHVFTEPGE